MVDSSTIDAFDLTYRADNERHRTADGAELYYEVEGQGPSLTFVSTIYVVSTAWRNFTRRIVEENSLLTYDLRNQGASSGTPAGYEQHLDDLASLLDGRGIEKTCLVGTSISTLICRDFALKYPDRVSAMVLVGPPMSPWGSKRRTRVTKSWLEILEAGGPRALFAAIYPLVFGDRAQAQGGTATYLALRERFLATNSRAQLHTNLTDCLTPSEDPALLGDITVPTLLLAGDDDFCISPTGLAHLAASMPDARHEVFEGTGHLPFFEDTDRFEESVLIFLRDLSTGEKEEAR